VEVETTFIVDVLVTILELVEIKMVVRISVDVETIVCKTVLVEVVATKVGTNDLSIFTIGLLPRLIV
jgi:hypothetical protein